MFLADESNMRDADEAINGLEISQGSDVECIAATEDDDAIYWSMVTKVTCDDTITAAGEPSI